MKPTQMVVEHIRNCPTCKHDNLCDLGYALAVDYLDEILEDQQYERLLKEIRKTGRSHANAMKDHTSAAQTDSQ